jgi:YD repeat-containing protein
VTRWEYHVATGLLTAKEDASGKRTTYTYAPGGRLLTRTWARTGTSNAPIVTTYGYDGSTGELTAIDYSDDTPDIAFTYDRLGRQHTVTDAAGTRTFAYNAHCSLRARRSRHVQRDDHPHV